MFSKTRQHLRCNVLFGLIGHFGLLKDVDNSFFLSLQWCLGVFLLELKRHREKLSKDSTTATQAHPQRITTTFFSRITPTNALSQSRATQMGSQPGHIKGFTIDWAIVICRARHLGLV